MLIKGCFRKDRSFSNKPYFPNPDLPCVYATKFTKKEPNKKQKSHLRISAFFAVYFVLHIKISKESHFRTGGFFRSQPKKTIFAQALIEQVENFDLQIQIEVNKDIAAYNYMKFIKGSVCHQIMVSKDHLFL